MVDEISVRIDEYLPAEVDAQDEIAMAIKDTAFPNDWDMGTVEAVAETVFADRKSGADEFGEEQRKQTTLAGQQDARTAMVQDAEGKFVGKPSEVITFEDTHGNTIVQKEGDNSTRTILTPKEEK